MNKDCSIPREAIGKINISLVNGRYKIHYLDFRYKGNQRYLGYIKKHKDFPESYHIFYRPYKLGGMQNINLQEAVSVVLQEFYKGFNVRAIPATLRTDSKTYWNIYYTSN